MGSWLSRTWYTQKSMGSSIRWNAVLRGSRCSALRYELLVFSWNLRLTITLFVRSFIHWFPLIDRDEGVQRHYTGHTEDIMTWVDLIVLFALTARPVHRAKHNGTARLIVICWRLCPTDTNGNIYKFANWTYTRIFATAITTNCVYISVCFVLIAFPHTPNRP